MVKENLDVNLTPCAHCAGNAVLVEDNRNILDIPSAKRLVYYVICKGCWIATRNEQKKDKAIETWNTRL